MAKKRTILVNIEPDKNTARAFDQLIEDVKKSFAKGFSGSFKEEFEELYQRSKMITDHINSFKVDEVSKKAFKDMNQDLADILDSFDKFVEKIVRDGDSLQIDLSLADGFERDIESSKEKIEELEKAIERVGRLELKGSREKLAKSMFDEDMKTRFEGFDGTPGSIGLKSLRKDIQQTEVYSKNIDIALGKLKELRKLQSDGKLTTKRDKDKLKELEGEENILIAIREIISQNNARIVSEQKASAQRIEDLEKERRKLEELQEQYTELKHAAAMDDPDTQAAIALQARGQALRGENQENKLRGQRSAEEQASKVISQETSDQVDSLTNTSKLTDEIIEKYFGVQAILRLISATYQKILTTVSDLDAAFVNIAVVTQYTNKEVWGMYDAFSNIAKGSGFSVAEIGQVAGEYFRQGESYTNVLKLTEAAAKAAKVAGIDAAESVRFLTSAVRGYNLAAEDAMNVSDKFAAVAASSATSYEGLATAMSKVAAQAYASGVEMDNLMGMLATSMEITQEAPENIGTAFKTIFARMAEIKDYGAVLEDGIDANRIERALKTVNVALFDQNRNMRSLDNVLLEVGKNWHTLNQSQKAYLATSLAGTRQQTRLLAVMENYDRTLENIETSRNSAGATEAQQIKNTESIAHNLNRIQVANENIISSVAGSKIVLATVKAIGSALEGMAGFADTFLGKWSLIAASTTAGVGFITTLVQKSEGFRDVLDVTKNTLKAPADALKAASIAGKSFGEALKTVTAQSKSGASGVGLLSTFMELFKKKAEGAAFAATAFNVATGAILITGAIAAGLALIKYFGSAERQINKVSDRVKELNAELYNIGKSGSDIKKLIEEYETLEKQLIKTTEEFSRMKEIALLLKDLDAKDQFSGLIRGDGYLNIGIAKAMLEANKKEEEKIFQERQKNREKLLRSYEKLTDSFEKMEAAAGLAVSTLADGMMEQWQSLSSDIQETAVQWAQTLAEGGSFIDAATGERTNKAQSRVYVGYKPSNTGGGGYEYVDNEQISFSEEEIRRVQEYTANVIEAETSIQDYINGLKESAGSSYELALANDALGSSLEEFADFTNISISNLRQMEQTFQVAKEYGVEFSDETRKALAKALDTGGVNRFSTDFVKAMQQAGTGVGNLLNISLSLIDAFDELTEDNLINMMTSFDSMEERIGNFGKALEDINTEALKEALDLVRQYPEVAGDMVDAIIETGNINEEISMRMVELERMKTKEAIQAEIDQNEVRIKMIKAQIKLAERMLADETELQSMASQAKLDISNMETEDIMSNVNKLTKAYEHEFGNIVRMANDAGIKIAAALDGDTQNDVLSGNVGAFRYTNRKDSDAYKQRLDHLKSTMQGQISSWKGQVSELENVNKLLEYSMDKIGTDAWNASKRFKDATDKAGDSAKDTAEAVELYYGELHKLYVAQKRLELVNWGLDLIKAKQSYAEAADAVRGLAGAQSDLYDMNAAEATEDMYASYELQKEELKNLISVSEEYMRHHESKLSPALKGTYKVINNQVYPVSKKYKNLTYEQMKELDEFAKSFNELGSSVQRYKTELLQAGQAQNELIASMRDTVIEYQELIIDAIKNEEKKYLDAFKKIIDANKKMLEERKKLYENSFKEQDQEEEMGDIADERQKVIEKLAALEAAHDISSIQKKEQYRKQLQELDDRYNSLMLERNREAFLQAIDSQIQYQDEVYQKEEEAHNERISSAEWLEARLEEIQDNGRLHSIIKNHLHNKTIQDMLDMGYITQEQITEAGITNMNQTIGDLSEEQLGIFEKYWKANRDVIDTMWNGGENEVGSEQMSKDAMDNILKYLTTHSSQMEGKTSTMKDKVVGEWKALMKKVAEYTNSFNAISLKAPDYSNVTKGMNNLLSQVRTATNGIVNEYARIERSANSAAQAQKNANNAKNNGGGTKTTTPPKTSTKTSGYQSVSYDRNGKIVGYGKDPYGRDIVPGVGGFTMSAYATGGTTERTGLHWLDGKPGAPERVLSPGANARFEELLGQLTVNAAEGNTGNNDEIISALMEVIKAIYDTSEESARIIANSLGSAGGAAGQTIYGIAKQNGISLNRRTDK